MTDWKLIFPTLSDYLMSVLLDVLVCVTYNTARYVLNEKGWSFYENEYADEEKVKEHLSQKKIDLSMMTKYLTCYSLDSFYRCCFDEEEKTLYVIIKDMSIMLIKAE